MTILVEKHDFQLITNTPRYISTQTWSTKRRRDTKEYHADSVIHNDLEELWILLYHHLLFDFPTQPTWPELLFFFLVDEFLWYVWLWRRDSSLDFFVFRFRINTNTTSTLSVVSVLLLILWTSERITEPANYWHTRVSNFLAQKSTSTWTNGFNGRQFIMINHLFLVIRLFGVPARSQPHSWSTIPKVQPDCCQAASTRKSFLHGWAMMNFSITADTVAHR